MFKIAHQPTFWQTLVSGSLLSRPCSWLMFHANKLPKDPFSIEKDLFYTVKNKMLRKYGKYVKTEFQHFEGKQCFTCDGTGIYYQSDPKYDPYGNDIEHCKKCNASGWYKDEKWVELEVFKFGKYHFHLPSNTRYVKPKENVVIIEGFIEHRKTRFTSFAFFVFMLMFHKNYIVKYYNSCRGWRCNWENPNNWLHNFCHILLKKQDAIPISNFLNKWKKFKSKYSIKRKKRYVSFQVTEDDLPF